MYFFWSTWFEMVGPASKARALVSSLLCRQQLYRNFYDIFYSYLISNIDKNQNLWYQTRFKKFVIRVLSTISEFWGLSHLQSHGVDPDM